MINPRLVAASEILWGVRLYPSECVYEDPNTKVDFGWSVYPLLYPNPSKSPALGTSMVCDVFEE